MLNLAVNRSCLLPLLRIAAVAGLAALALPSRADTIVAVDLSNIKFVGNNSCNGSCTDIFNATYEFDATTDSVVGGTLNVSNTGILSTVQLYSTTTYSIQFNSTAPSTYESVIWDFSPYSPFPEVGTSPHTYSLGDLNLLCENGPCSAEFDAGYTSASSGSITVSAVNAGVAPEPSSLSLLGSGLLAMAGLGRQVYTRRRRIAL
jgi:hypothetical protein